MIKFEHLIGLFTMCVIIGIQVVRLLQGEFSYDILLIILLSFSSLVYISKDAIQEKAE